MFVSHFSSFFFYLYDFALVQRKNRLARDMRFLAIPGSTGKIGSCSGKLQNTITTMAADGGNAETIPRASAYNFGGVEGVYGPQCAPLFRR
jgi:hypothetical protein